jgi:hypothetical protein
VREVESSAAVRRREEDGVTVVEVSGGSFELRGRA